MTLLRSLLFNLFYFTSTAVLLIPGIAVWLFFPSRSLALATLWARVELAAARLICGIKLEVTGREHLPQGAALIASRHESAFDTLVWLLLVPRPSYVMKQELTRIPIFGGMVRPAGMIPVDRDGGGAAMRALMRAGADAAKAGRQIIIFPEGTRMDPGRDVELQPGIAALAAATRLPVIPVVTDSGSYWGRRAFRKRPGTIRIVILPPLPAGLARGALMEGLGDAMRTGMAALRPGGT